MTVVKLYPGSKLLLGEEMVTFIVEVSAAHGIVRFNDGSQKRVAITKLRPLPTAKAIAKTRAAEERARDNQMRKWRILAPLFKGVSPDRAFRVRIRMKEYEERFNETGVPISTLQTWATQVRQHGFEGLYSPPPTGGRGKTRISEDAQNRIKAHLPRYLKRPGDIIEDIVVRTKGHCDQTSASVSERTIQRRLAKIPRRRAIKSRKGRKELKRVLASHTRGFYELAHPWDLVMIDEGWIAKASRTSNAEPAQALCAKCPGGTRGLSDRTRTSSCVPHSGSTSASSVRGRSRSSAGGELAFGTRSWRRWPLIIIRPSR